ncbi:hypothetical protein [Mariniflexile fucanivorans]|nr:hypothetical protein [Mariniflexile fucanivorans]
MTKYIVVNKDSFEIIESEKEPLNIVLKEPNKTYSKNTYTLVTNNVSISWLDEYKWNGRWKCLTVTYKKTKLLEINAVEKPQIVIDTLKRFKNISEEELEKLYEKALNNEKTDLEQEVEKLKEEKVEMQKAYCGACMEDPCMCSDPEQTSTTLDW